MLTEEAIRQSLHADRVVPLTVANPHGPLGLEELAAAFAAHRQGLAQPGRVRRVIEFPVQTWERLHTLAAESSKPGSPTVASCH